jgi:hypothetical protein
MAHGWRMVAMLSAGVWAAGQLNLHDGCGAVVMLALEATSAAAQQSDGATEPVE